MGNLVITIKGSASSGWYAPPKGTHTGEQHRAVGSGKAGGWSGKKAKVEVSRKRSPSGQFTSTDVKRKIRTPDRIRGAFESYVVTFEDGTKAILKTDKMYAPNEVMAYDISSSIGWDIVPETVLTKDGSSMQRWIPNSKRAADIMDDNWDVKDPPGTQLDRARMDVLDHIIGNMDRHEGNWIYEDLGDGKAKLWAIDHGIAFGSTMGRTVPSWYNRTPEHKQAWSEVADWLTSSESTDVSYKIAKVAGSRRQGPFESLARSVRGYAAAGKFKDVPKAVLTLKGKED